MPEPPDTRPVPPLTASGLDEAQLDPADLQALRDAVKLRTCGLEAGATFRRLEDFHPELQLAGLHFVECGLLPLQALALRLAPLPRQAAVRRLAWREPQAVVRHATALAQQQPVRRSRLRPDDLPPAQLKALLAAMYKKYGPEAGELEIAAVFAHVPPEAKAAIGIDPALRWAAFTLPAGTTPQAAHAGYYLVVLRAKNNETRKVLFRL